MMSRTAIARGILLPSCVISAVILFGLSHDAEASFRINLTDVGSGTSVTIYDNATTLNSTLPVGTVDDQQSLTLKSISYNDAAFAMRWDVDITVNTTYPGTGFLGSLLQDISIVSRNTGTGVGTLRLDVFSDDVAPPVLVTTPTLAGFTDPTGADLELFNTLASSFMSSANPANKLEFQSYFDDGANGTADASTSIADLTTVPMGGASEGTQTSVSRTTTRFGLQNTLTITLGAGQGAQATGTTQIMNIIPEPTTLLSALPLLMIGGGLYLRRRKVA
jgi:hypothetical protein